MQIADRFPALKKRLLLTFRGYLEAEKKDDPKVAEDQEWQQAYQSVTEREKVAEQVHLVPDAFCTSVGLSEA